MNLQIKNAIDIVKNDIFVNEKLSISYEIAKEMSYEIKGSNLNIKGKNIPQILRLFAIANKNSIKGDHTYSEYSDAETLGMMLDSSRNAVLRIDSIYILIRKLALMGYNMLMLYTEDTYKVEDYPEFGYMRGGYTKEELKLIDDYAYNLGIEVVPCIQTLGHCGQMLVWDAFSNIKDLPEVLLVDEPKTYKFIETIIDTYSDLRSKRIHIGMDEVHGLGFGQFFDKHGYENAFDIFNRHLEKVCNICKEKDLNPMIWSDMYFRIASKTNDYYDMSSDIPQEVADKIHPSVELVYWDYYNRDEAFYTEWINRHRKLGKEPIFAGGVWTWGTFVQSMKSTIDTTLPALSACKKENIKEILTTAWGDDGNECPFNATFYGFNYFANALYIDNLDTKTNEELYNIFTKENSELYETAQRMDIIPQTIAYNDPDTKELAYYTGPSKYFLWEDILIGSISNYIEKRDEIKSHYTKLANDIDLINTNTLIDTEYKEFLLTHAKALASKAVLGYDIIKAYKNQDKKALSNLIETDLNNAILEISKMKELHFGIWNNHYKRFGWEILERRYSSTISRLQTLKSILTSYVDGKIDTIEELDEKRLEVFPRQGKDLLPVGGYIYMQLSSTSITR